jgi:hypothetical protein
LAWAKALGECLHALGDKIKEVTLGFKAGPVDFEVKVK